MLKKQSSQIQSIFDISHFFCLHSQQGWLVISSLGYIRKRRGSHASLLIPTLKPRMLPCQEREVCRGPRIYGNIPCTTMAQRESCLYTQASTAASHDLAIELRVRASIKALVNAYSNIYVRWFICQSDSLLDVAKIGKIWYCQYVFPEKRKNMRQKNADFVKYYGKLSGFMR